MGKRTPGGAAADIRQFWAWTKGHSFVAEEEYTEVLGEPFSVTRARVVRWADRRSDAIGALARVLEPGRELSADASHIYVADCPKREPCAKSPNRPAPARSAWGE